MIDDTPARHSIHVTGTIVTVSAYLAGSDLVIAINVSATCLGRVIISELTTVDAARVRIGDITLVPEPRR